MPEQICTECLYDLDVAFRFRKNCERSDAILQRFLDPTDDTDLSEEYIEQPSNDPLSSSRASKDSRVLVSSDAGLYEYRPPVGLNVKLVKGETSGRVLRTNTKKSSSTNAAEHTIYLKSEPMDEETLDDSDNIDLLYDIDTNFEDSTDAVDKPIESIRKGSTKASASTTNESDSSKIMQIKPVRTNKVRLGFTSANKSKTSASVSVKSKASSSSENGSKENTATATRSPKSKTNAKGEPKQPKKCEICGNTYMYQHALER